MLLAEYFEVVLVDVDEEKIKKIENKQKPIDEPLLQDFLNEKSLNLSATTSYKEDLATSDLVILALPTNYDEVANFFDTSILEKVLTDISASDSNATVVIKSTIPIGFTEKVRKAFPKFSIPICCLPRVKTFLNSPKLFLE